jgi:ornithine cyclodeaminase
MKIITEETLIKLIKTHGLKKYLIDLIEILKKDFSKWNEFNLIPRPAMHVKNGVLELMPICNKDYYSYKYVNCHPKNYKQNLMTVVATGQLSQTKTGYPLMYSEMTLLTALRTAATTAIATDLMSRKNSKILAVIGTGAQSEFLTTAIRLVRDINQINFYDIDDNAMDKFEKNINDKSIKMIRCNNVKDAVKDSDIITTCTACKAHVQVLKNDWIKKGVHINGIGGDTEGKTELEDSILHRSSIIVEYLKQCVVEGEIQQLNKDDIKKYVKAELHELITNKKKGRNNDQEITLYDSVGIALEDYSVLRFTYDLANKYNLGKELNLTPNLADPKNLISMIK